MMKLVLGQVKEVDGKFTMNRAVELPEELKTLPVKQIKGVLYHAYLQLLEVERRAEISELDKLLQASE